MRYVELNIHVFIHQYYVLCVNMLGHYIIVFSLVRKNMIFLTLLLINCHLSSQTRKAEENLESLPRQPRTESK